MSNDVLNAMLNRGKSANNSVPAKKLDEKTAIIENTAHKQTTREPVTTKTTTEDIVKQLQERSGLEKKRINVSLDQDVFEKIVTLAGGKSASNVMERLLTVAVENVDVNHDIVAKYNNTMKSKGKK